MERERCSEALGRQNFFNALPSRTLRAHKQEATARCANRRLPVSFKALIRRLTIGGHARQPMIPLASDLLPFPGQMRREGHLNSASLPDRLSSSGRAVILDSISQNCPELLSGSVDKTVWRGKQTTESTQQRRVLRRSLS